MTARRSDPETSHEAVPEEAAVSAVQERLMLLFHLYGPMHDRRLIREYRTYYPLAEQWASDQSIRTRRKELESKGLVAWTGEFVWLPGMKRDRRHRTWKAAA